ncbi:hypothetical protein [Parasphingorhabdus sp. NYA22]
MKFTKNAKIIAGLFLTSCLAQPALSEPPEYKEKRDSGNPGQWESKQYERADRMDRQGESKKAQEVRDYANDRATQNREASKRAEDNWPN